MTQPYLGGEKVNEKKLMVSHLGYPTDATTAWGHSPDYFNEAHHMVLALSPLAGHQLL